MAQDGSKSEKARTHKTLIFPEFWKDVGLLGGPRGDSRHSRGATLIGDALFFDRSPTRWPQERPEGSQERPKSAPRGPQEAPRGAHDASKRLPRDPQKAPRESKMAQDGSKSEKARKHKTLIFYGLNDFGLLGGPKRRFEAL